LEENPQKSENEPYRADLTVGMMAGLWDLTSLGMGLPMDQTQDDIRSLVYTTEPLEQGVEITGSPEAIIFAQIEEGDDAHFVVKLNDVGPGGTSDLITTGFEHESLAFSH
jgi:predicted acyl esterase